MARGRRCTECDGHHPGPPWGTGRRDQDVQESDRCEAGRRPRLLQSRTDLRAQILQDAALLADRSAVDLESRRHQERHRELRAVREAWRAIPRARARSDSEPAVAEVAQPIRACERITLNAKIAKRAKHLFDRFFFAVLAAFALT